MKSKKLLDSFVKYCEDHPEQRFWQALTNWSEYHFIYGSKGNSFDNDVQFEDTFYKEN